MVQVFVVWGQEGQNFSKDEVDSLNRVSVQRVTKVQEYNSNNEPANPIIFEYNQTNYTATEYWENANSDLSLSATRFFSFIKKKIKQNFICVYIFYSKNL